MVPPTMEKEIKTSPKDKFLEEEVPNPEDEPIYEEEDLDEVGTDETPAPTNTQAPATVSQAQIELQLELKIRKLAELETQMITKKIALKNSDSLTGVYNEQEMISFCQTLKFEIQSMIDFMKNKFAYENKYFIDKFKEIEKGLKKYEYWVVADKKKS